MAGYARHLRIEDQQAGLDEPQGGDMELLKREQHLAAPLGGGNLLGRPRRLDAVGHVVATVVRDLVHGNDNAREGDLEWPAYDQ